LEEKKRSKHIPIHIQPNNEMWSSSRKTNRRALLGLLLLAVAGTFSGSPFGAVVTASDDAPSDPRFDSAQEAAAAARERMEHAAQAAAQAAADAANEAGEAVAETAEAVFDHEDVASTTATESMQRTLEDVAEQVQDSAEQVYESVKVPETVATAPMTQEERTSNGRSLKNIVTDGLSSARQAITRVTDCVGNKAMDIKTSIANMERKDAKKVAAAAVGAWGLAVGVGYLTTPRGPQQQ
jgi:hypothetical protein